MFKCRVVGSQRDDGLLTFAKRVLRRGRGMRVQNWHENFASRFLQPVGMAERLNECEFE